MKAIRVVLAEDHPAVREIFRNILGLEADIRLIAEAANGGEAILAVRVHKPHVLMLDLSMPIMNGFAVIRELASSESSVRILVVSAFNDQGLISQVLETGVSGYLVKEDAAWHLADAIRKVAAGGKWVSGQPAAPLLPIELLLGNVLVIRK
jgi:two-component system response regulator DesR